MIEYPIIVFWSEEDGEYVADVPDIKYCSALAPTPEEALREVLVALEEILADARDRGIQLPPPTLRPTLAKAP
jgi:predicted RNase H-like HicB family nuclease